MFEMPDCRFAFNSKGLVLMGAVVGWLVIANGAISPGQPVSPKDGLLLSVVPTGSVIPYAGQQIPPGWLECNGQVVK